MEKSIALFLVLTNDETFSRILDQIAISDEIIETVFDEPSLDTLFVDIK